MAIAKVPNAGLIVNGRQSRMVRFRIEVEGAIYASTGELDRIRLADGRYVALKAWVRRAQALGIEVVADEPMKAGESGPHTPTY